MTENRKPASNDAKHEVQFYESEGYLTEVVSRFIREGVAAGEPVIIIAASEHRESLTAALRDDGFDVDSSVRVGKLVFLDARNTLSTFMVGGMPDDESFKKQIGGVIEKARVRKPGATVRAFGEMVDLLWRDGNSEAAVRLEELWNQLAATHDFALLCGYTMSNFDGEAHTGKFEYVCGQHTHVKPTEQYSKASDSQARLHEITLLQQRARSLESEMERRKALELSLRELVSREQAARSEAENASRLKDEFLAILSHELRTPLNAILGWSQILESRSDPQTVARALDVIGRNAKLQLSLINDLLDVSRIMTGKMVLKSDPVDLGQVIRASLDTVRPAALAKGIETEAFVDEPAPFMVGDADRLQQVLWNILMNAIKFTPKGGKVELRLEQDDSHLRILVKDTGIGIEPAFLPFVFDRFRQGDTGTTRRTGGLGIGLAVARYLVEAHGGTISAESAGPGFGATFTISFPISRPDDQADREQAAKNRPVLEGFHILVVDDERDTCELFKFVLEEAGASVGVALSADEALNLLASQPFDLVLADIGMPNKDGYAFIAAVRAHPMPEVRNILMIAVTSYTAEHFRTQAEAAGFDDFITKPVSPAQLTKSVAERLIGRAR